MVVGEGEQPYAVADTDLFGLGRDHTVEDLGRGAVGELVEAVVLDRPESIEPHFFGEHNLFYDFMENPRLGLRPPFPRHRDLVKNSEFHRVLHNHKKICRVRLRTVSLPRLCGARSAPYELGRIQQFCMGGPAWPPSPRAPTEGCPYNARRGFNSKPHQDLGNDKVMTYPTTPLYIPLISSSTVPSGSLKHTTPILAPPGPSTLYKGATNWTFFAFSSSYVLSMSSTVKAMRQMPTLLSVGYGWPWVGGAINWTKTSTGALGSSPKRMNTPRSFFALRPSASPTLGSSIVKSFTFLNPMPW